MNKRGILKAPKQVLMSKQRILKALNEKSIKVSRLEFERGIPTPSGYCNGWTIEFSDEVQEKLYHAGYRGVLDPDARTYLGVLVWIINDLPDLTGTE